MAFCNQCGAKIEGSAILCPDCMAKQSIIELYFNDKYSYFTGTRRPVDFKLTNLSDKTLEDIKVVRVCNEVEMSETSTLHRLEPQEETVLASNFFFPEGSSGAATIRINVSLVSEGKLQYYTGQLDIDVFKGRSEQGGNIINIRGDGDVKAVIQQDSETSSMGGPLSDQDQLLREERMREDLWRSISLRKAASRYFLSAKPSAARTRSIALVNRDDPSIRYYLFSRPELVFGRPSEEMPDICTVCYPYNPEDSDSLSHRISRKQIKLSVREGELVIRNLTSPYSLGTVVDGKRLATDEEITFSHHVSVNLAMVLGLDFEVHKVRKTSREVITSEEWAGIHGVIESEEEDSILAGLYDEEHVACVSVKRRPLQSIGSRNGECYLFVPRFAEVGADKRCAIILPDSSLPDFTARIYYYGGNYYLHVIEQGLAVTNVEGHKPDGGEVMPLEAGMQLNFGNSRWNVETAQWVFALPGE